MSDTTTSTSTASNTPPHDAGTRATARELTQAIKLELLQLDFVEKSNDLYQFRQTKKDLRDANVVNKHETPHLAQFIEQLCAESTFQALEAMLNAVPGEEDTVLDRNSVDASGFVYGDTDYLLPHDDNISASATTRKIAFIFYLLPDYWDSKVVGGRLDLLTYNAGEGPTALHKSLMPQHNALSMFVVSEKSWHQVSEVTAVSPYPSAKRVSIAGWFHAQTPRKASTTAAAAASGPTTSYRVCPQDEKAFQSEEEATQFAEKSLADTFRGLRTSETAQFFQQQGSFEWHGLFSAEFVAQLKQDLRAAPFSPIGPPLHVWNFDHVSEEYLEQKHASLVALRQTIAWLQSDDFAMMLGLVLGLDGKLELICGDVRRFQHGSYTLCSDQLKEMYQERLEVHMWLVDSAGEGEDDEEQVAWSLAFGGSLSYLAEREELITVEPQDNSLSLVWCDTSDEAEGGKVQPIMSFLKYVNHHCGKRRLYHFYNAYTFVPHDDDDDEDEEDAKESKTKAADATPTATQRTHDPAQDGIEEESTKRMKKNA